jgi:lysyl-tRNA synthetase class 2
LRFTLREKTLADQSIQDTLPNDQTRARREHLEGLRQLVGNVYPNKFTRSQVVTAGREDTISAIVEKFRGFQPQAPADGRPAAEDIEQANQELNNVNVRLAGRIATPPRVMGKAAFVHLSDGVARLQIYAKKADVKAVNNDTGALIEEEGKGWELFGLLDHGDFIGVEGYLFVTKTGELSVHVQALQFLAKALMPMPDKMHGINDPEIRQRQRYADLIAGSLKLDRAEGELTPREVFERRSAIIREMRRFLEEHGYIEVETPMLTPLATGAAAKAFETYHNALSIPLYARIAPELYLKRLLVGGFEKVYELNRNFRNEGIDRIHNPEFTMLEFYWAYADVNQMMDFSEELLRSVVYTVTGGTRLRYGQHEIDFSQPFQRMSMIEAIGWAIGNHEQQFETLSGQRFQLIWFNTKAEALHDLFLWWALRNSGGDHPSQAEIDGYWETTLADSNRESRDQSPQEWADHIVKSFELIAELHLVRPTFITDFPKVISPLSKASPTNPAVAERFEYFVGGLESGNGFSELNDPAEQFQRFKDQTQQREQGDEEAMVMDEDYIRALSYGMPPAAGIGIGIDRFTMLLTNRQSIRDVILFPHLRPERKREEAESEPPAVAGG